MNLNIPKISVITVTLNAAYNLAKTLESVTGQDYTDLEIIVIDGGSTDGTVEVIRTFSDHIACWISEPDQGIYNAMNKGLAVAKGEWVNFMNAGDVFFNSGVLTDVFKNEVEDAGVVYGDSIANYNSFKAMRKALPVKELWKGMICCHQAMFFRTSLIKNMAYRPELYYSADYELIYRLYNAGKNFRYIPMTIAVFDTRGASNQNMVKSARSNLEIMGNERTLTPKEKRFHNRIICQAGVTEWLYRHMPESILLSVLKLVYHQHIIQE